MTSERDWVELAARGIQALAVLIMVVRILVETVRWIVHARHDGGKGLRALPDHAWQVAADRPGADGGRRHHHDRRHRAHVAQPRELGALVVVRTALGWTLTVEIEGHWPWAAGASPDSPRPHPGCWQSLGHERVVRCACRGGDDQRAGVRVRPIAAGTARDGLRRARGRTVPEIHFAVYIAACIDAERAGSSDCAAAVKAREKEIVGAEQHATRLRKRGDRERQCVRRLGSRVPCSLPQPGCGPGS